MQSRCRWENHPKSTAKPGERCEWEIAAKGCLRSLHLPFVRSEGQPEGGGDHGLDLEDLASTGTPETRLVAWVPKPIAQISLGEGLQSNKERSLDRADKRD